VRSGAWGDPKGRLRRKRPRRIVQETRSPGRPGSWDPRNRRKHGESRHGGRELVDPRRPRNSRVVLGRRAIHRSRRQRAERGCASDRQKVCGRRGTRGGGGGNRTRVHVHKKRAMARDFRCQRSILGRIRCPRVPWSPPGLGDGLETALTRGLLRLPPRRADGYAPMLGLSKRERLGTPIGPDFATSWTIECETCVADS